MNKHGRIQSLLLNWTQIIIQGDTQPAPAFLHKIPLARVNISREHKIKDGSAIIGYKYVQTKISDHWMCLAFDLLKASLNSICGNY